MALGANVAVGLEIGIFSGLGPATASSTVGIWIGANTCTMNGGSNTGIQIDAMGGNGVGQNTNAIKISGIATGAGTNNCGISIGNIGGAANNYAINTGTGNIWFGGSQMSLGGAAFIGGAVGQFNIPATGNIYKNASAYTNPDYVFEQHFTGKIERYKDSEGAANYRVMTLEEIEEFAKENLYLPGVEHENPCGIFDRADITLEKIEELYLFMFEKERQIKDLRGKIEKLEEQIAMA
jgi:hypothetical protein